MTEKNKDIGYIGLGNMGVPIVANLLSAGFVVHSIKNRREIAPELLSNGLIIEKSLPDIAKKCQIIFTNLPDAPEIDEVIYGNDDKEGLIKNLQRDSIIIDNSTIAPQAAINFAKKLMNKNVSFVDAPVSGGVVGAKAGTLTIMVGASEQLYNQVLPILETIGKLVTRIGETGTGQICKAANQIAIAGALGAVAEALIFAKKNGVAPALVRKVLMAGAANSKVLEFQGGRMVDKDYVPKFSNKLYHKDLQIVLENARENGIALPTTALVFQLINAQKAQGMEDLDAAAIIKVIANLSGVEY